MRKYILIFLINLIAVAGFSQKTMFIHKGRIALGLPVSATDSMYFSSDKKIAYFQMGDSARIHFSHLVAEIDSITFSNNSDTVYIIYDNSDVSIINPFAYQGVDISINSAEVKVNSSFAKRDVIYNLSGTSGNGYCKFYSGKRFNVVLDGLTLTNPSGPAINIQANKKVTVTLMDGKSNYLTDGSTYSKAPLSSSNKEEDQKGTFFSEGQLIFNGNGALKVKSLSKNGIASDDYVRIDNGKVEIVSAIKNGIRTQEGFIITGGSLVVNSTSSGIDGDKSYVDISGGSVAINITAAGVSAIKCDSTISISGGTVDVTLSGNNSHSFKAGKLVYISGGTINSKNSGGVVLTSSGSGYDVAYSNGIKSDSLVIIDGGNITLIQNGIAGRGIVADSKISILSGTVTITNSGNGAVYTDNTGKSDTYRSSGLKSKKDIDIIGGNLTITSSGTAGTGVSLTGNLTVGNASSSPTINITTTGARITVSNGNYDQSKAISSNQNITINNGNITISSADDGIKSEVSATFNGGTVTILNSVEGIESPLITVNDGKLHVKASNDGFNASYGTVSGGTNSNDGSHIYFNGGYVYASSETGDALDANGNITVNGGTVIAMGPSSFPEQSVDFNGTLLINGGFFIGSGPNSFLVMAMSNASTQRGMLLTTNTAVTSSSLFRIQDASGNDIVTFKPERSSNAFLVSSPLLKTGSTYSIYTGGTSTGTATDGIYSGGTYSGGTLKKTLTINSNVTQTTF